MNVFNTSMYDMYIYMYIVIHCNNICNYTSIPAGLSPSNDFDTTAVPPQCRVNFVDEQGLMFFFQTFDGCGPVVVTRPRFCFPKRVGHLHVFLHPRVWAGILLLLSGDLCHES